MTGFAFVPIVPDELNVDGMLAILDKELEKFAEKKLKPDFDSSHATFKHPLKTKIEKTTTRKKLSRTVFVSDKAYYFVSKGTKKRWAVMSSDWRSKTKPKRIPSGKGRGRAVLIGKRAMQRRGMRARPGIKGRKFDKQIAKKRKREFIRDMRGAMKFASRQAFV